MDTDEHRWLWRLMGCSSQIVSSWRMLAISIKWDYNKPIPIWSVFICVHLWLIPLWQHRLCYCGPKHSLPSWSWYGNRRSSEPNMNHRCTQINTDVLWRLMGCSSPIVSSWCMLAMPIKWRVQQAYSHLICVHLCASVVNSTSRTPIMLLRPQAFLTLLILTW